MRRMLNGTRLTLLMLIMAAIGTGFTSQALAAEYQMIPGLSAQDRIVLAKSLVEQGQFVVLLDVVHLLVGQLALPGHDEGQPARRRLDDASARVQLVPGAGDAVAAERGSERVVHGDVEAGLAPQHFLRL